MLRSTLLFALAVLGIRFILRGMRLRRVAQKMASSTNGPRWGDDDQHWLLGSLPEMTRERARMHDHRVDLCKKHDCQTWTPNPPRGWTFMFGCQVLPIVTSDPKNVEYILKTKFNNFIKGDKIRLSLIELLGDGIFIANHAHTEDDGASWKLQRKIASRIFTGNRFRNYMHGIFVSHAETVIEVLTSHAKSESVFDIVPLFFKYTMDSIGEIGFGIHLNTLKEDFVPFVHAFDEVQRIGFSRNLSPSIQLLASLLGDSWSEKVGQYIFPEEKEIAGHLRTLDEFALSVIADRAANPPTESSQDLLSLFMLEGGEKGEGFDDRFLKDIIMSFIIAGRDTTAVTFSWAFFVLLQHPEIFSKLVIEIDEKLDGKTPTYDDMKNLPYLDGVINEVLRLHPPVPIDPKEAAEDDTLPDGTFVPKGQTVAYDVYGMGRNSKLWPDPYKVQPERWIGKQKPSQYHFPVFQAGPRICLGMNMAYFEAKLLIIMILQRFTMELVSDPKEVTYIPTVTLNMTKMDVKISSR